MHAQQFIFIAGIIMIWRVCAGDRQSGDISQLIEKWVIIYGDSQSGKSTFVNAIFEQNLAETGDGSGASVTQNFTIYSKLFTSPITSDKFQLNIIDIPGNLDTNLRWTDKDILKNLEFSVIKAGQTNKIDVMFVAEELSSGATQLQRHLNAITLIFGESVTKSVVILGLKPNQSVSNLHSYVRINSVKQVCDKLNVQFLSYESNAAHDYNAQFASFMDLLFDDNITPYQMDEVDKTRQQITDRAKELMAKAPKRYKMVNYTAEVERLEPVEKEEKYWDRQWGVVGWDSGFWFWEDDDEIYGWIPVQRTRMITIYKPYTAIVPKQKLVEVPYNISEFIPVAEKEWENKIKALFQINVEFPSSENCAAD